MKKLLIISVLLIAGSAMAASGPGTLPKPLPAMYSHHSTPHLDPVLALHASNTGIGSFGYDVNGTVIRIWETWTSTTHGMVEFRGLPLDVDYTAHKYVENLTTEDWDRFALELLDPAGDLSDNSDNPSASWVPEGFSHSGEDGLSFAQGAGIPRTSTVFAGRFDNEHGNYDYIDFYSGVLRIGVTDTFMFGVHDALADPSNQPFLLAQRPNASSGDEPVIPEPTTIILFGLGLGGVAIGYRFKK